MPSAALVHWQTDRMVRLSLVDSHCGTLLGVPPASPAGLVTPAPSSALAPLAQESLEGFVMLVSGHFQGFCRDLYTECAQGFASALPTPFRDIIQIQFHSELKLNTGNPTLENIRKDFERYGISLDLAQVHPGNATRMTQLGHLNYWRNAVAHQKSIPPPVGIPGVLTLAGIQSWQAACDGLATSLDAILYREMFRILGVASW